MPETALGSFPDVGASYYLSRLPGFFGEYVGLMGARLDGAEMLACGLATHFVPLEKLSSLDDALCKATTGDPKIINNIILHDFSNKNPTLKEKSHYFRLKTINSCFSRRTVEEIISALEEGDKKMDDWISWTIQALKKASATSLKISLRSVSTYTALRAGVYLESDILPHREIDAVDPKSRHKGNLETEILLESKGVNYTSIRPVYIYGPGPLNYNPVEEWIFHRLKAGRPIPIPKSGLQVTQLGHVNVSKSVKLIIISKSLR
uniref:3-hydroxyisobutyryl-CoA hydrolase n=1 Tax=Helianthus annuus TaxID=4232 RepID=A0A251TB17_HELAN